MKKQNNLSLAYDVTTVARIHFAMIGLFIVALVLGDAWNLFASSAVLERWMGAASLLALSAGLWYAARNTSSNFALKAFLWIFILADILMTTWLVYSERGMASKSVMFYAVPILAAAFLRTRSAIFATATLCLAAYSTALVQYFVTSPGEGYKVQLYDEIILFGGFFFVLASFVWAAVRKR